MKHGYRNEQGLYWNSKTGKWVVRLQKTTTDKALAKIKKEYSAQWETHAWLPIGLTIKMLEEDAKLLWKNKKKFKVDRAIALATLLIIKRNSASEKTKNSFYYKAGWTNVRSKDLKRWVHSTDYEKYLQFFQDAFYLEKDDRYASGSYSKQFRW